MEDFRTILVEAGSLVRIKNPTNYRLIGRGSQGAVFLLGDGKCVKIYSKEETAQNEIAAHRQAADSGLTPRIYETGPNYIVMEYIEGINLADLLVLKKSVSRTLTKKIIRLLYEIKELGFPRVDFNLRHVIIAGRGKLRLIDPVHMLKNRGYGPKNILHEMDEIGVAQEFLTNVKDMEPELYSEWANNMNRIKYKLD